MAETPPHNPRLAWQQDESPQNRSHGMPMVQPVQAGPEPLSILPCSPPPPASAPHWLPVYQLERKSIDCIKAFVNSRGKGPYLKTDFLASICSVFKTARLHGLQHRLDAFCQSYQLIENIRMLLEQEPMTQLSTAVRHLAMEAITELSSAEAVLAGQEKSLLEACFRSVFFLPPDAELMHSCPLLYICTLWSMDKMLLSIVLCFQTLRLSEELQSILQMLLDFTYSDNNDVRERAMGRILTLTSRLSKTTTLEDWHHCGRSTYGPICYGDFPIPILGQLLGRVMVLQASNAVIGCHALDTLICLYEFVHNQTSRFRTEGEKVKLSCRPDSSSLLHSPSTKDFLLLFANYLHPAERTDLVDMAIKGLRGSNACENQGAKDVLDVVMKDPGFWLVDVSRIMSSIHENLEAIETESAQQSVVSLLVVLSAYRPLLVAVSLLKFSAPQDSAGMAMWDLMLSLSLDKIFMELLLKPQDAEDFSILADPMASSGFQPKQDESQAERHQSHPSLPMVSLLLSTLIMLSETPAMAQKMKALLPCILFVIQHGNKELKLKALQVVRNVLCQLLRREASPMAMQLPQHLLPILHEECPELRELSIRLFRSLLESVVSRDKQRMRSSARLFLLPLFLHTRDQVHGVAEASKEALFAAAELLGWRELQHLLETEQLWRIGECLALQSRSRAKECLYQSLEYLDDAQALVREAAVRFIGVAARPYRGINPVMLLWICGALEMMLDDSNPVVQSLAHQNLLILRAPVGRQRSRWDPRSLWRRCC